MQEALFAQHGMCALQISGVLFKMQEALFAQHGSCVLCLCCETIQEASSAWACLCRSYEDVQEVLPILHSVCICVAQKQARLFVLA